MRTDSIRLANESLVQGKASRIPGRAETLYTSASLLQAREDVEALWTVAAWAREFLARPHQDLGRSGSVCPFAQKALDLGGVYFAVVRTDEATGPEIEAIVGQFRDMFLQLEPKDGESAVFKAVLVVFPGLRAEDVPLLIDAVQAKLKPSFVAKGLMIGQFHASNDTPGLWNPDFRPLRSPIPLLAIRFMVPGDFDFLTGSTYPPDVRLAFVNNYLSVFRNLPGARLEDAKKALAEARAELAVLGRMITSSP